jgi:hypothetical protein
MRSTYDDRGLGPDDASNLREIFMSQSTPDDTPAPAPAAQIQVSAYMLQTMNIQVSDPIEGIEASQRGVPGGTRYIQLLAILPPGLIAEEKMNSLLMSSGIAKNPLDGAVVRPPQLELVIRVDRLTPEAREQLAAVMAGGHPEEEAGEVLPPLPDLLGARGA